VVILQFSVVNSQAIHG